LGGAETHNSRSGVAHFMVKSMPQLRRMLADR
jgi:hypothetical protein